VASETVGLAAVGAPPGVRPGDAVGCAGPPPELFFFVGPPDEVPLDDCCLGVVPLAVFWPVPLVVFCREPWFLA
jgi:hypothetical protein